MLDGMYQIVLYFQDTEAAREWYEKAGFQQERGYRGMYWFRIGGTLIMLHPAKKSSGQGGIGLHARVVDVQALFQQAVARGLRPVDHQQGMEPIEAPVTRPWGDKEFELIDPEGYRWAFTQPA